MRDIKFRAWDKKKKTMVGRMWPKMAINSDGTFGFPEDKLYFLMQFTGLKDKNGKEIYEGDILKCETSSRDYGGEVVAEVIYSGIRFGVKTWAGTVDCLWNLSEVIGNIYENPELLTKER